MIGTLSVLRTPLSLLLHSKPKIIWNRTFPYNKYAQVELPACSTVFEVAWSKWGPRSHRADKWPGERPFFIREHEREREEKERREQTRQMITKRNGKMEQRDNAGFPHPLWDWEYGSSSSWAVLLGPTGALSTHITTKTCSACRYPPLRCPLVMPAIYSGASVSHVCRLRD